MKISAIEESYFEDYFLEKIKMQSKKDAVHYSLQFIHRLVDCVLIALGIDLVLELKDLLEENFLDEIDEEKLIHQFKNFVETEDETVRLEFQKEIGYKNFFLFMLRICFFNLSKEKKHFEKECQFLDILYKKLN